MREILFRGKPITSKEWIYGDLLQYAVRYKYSCYKKTKQLIGNIYDNPELLEESK